MVNLIQLEPHTEAALDEMVGRCASHLKDKHNIRLVSYPKGIEYKSDDIERKVRYGCNVDGPVWAESYSKRICLPENPTGNLYALHSRFCTKSAWTLRYVGKATDLTKRLYEHLVTVNENTSSQLWRVAYQVSKGHEIGISWINVAGQRANTTLAITMYVEALIILQERLKVGDGHGGWNTRVG